MKHYILEDEKVIEETDVLKWVSWFENANRQIANNYVGQVQISTVFLGIDHFFGNTDIPILFETMIFGGEYDNYQERYCTLEEAKEGHKKWYKKVLSPLTYSSKLFLGLDIED